MSRVVLGDCLSILPTLPDRCVDMVLTDPPYLVNYQDRAGRSIANDINDDWLAPAFKQIHRVMRDDTLCISFYGWNRVDRFFAAWRAAGLRAVGHIVFAKQYQSKARFLGYRHEAAYLLAKGQPPVPEKPLPDVMPWKYSGNRHHPTQKPVECLAPLIEAFTQPRGIVLDPFAGSGSTCVAARQVGRRFYGIEMDPKYHAAAMERLHLVLACLACESQSPTNADCITAFLVPRGPLRHVLTRLVLGLRPALRMRPPLLPLSSRHYVIQIGTGSATHRTGGNNREDKVQRFQSFTTGLTIYRPGGPNEKPLQKGSMAWIQPRSPQRSRSLMSRRFCRELRIWSWRRRTAN